MPPLPGACCKEARDDRLELTARKPLSVGQWASKVVRRRVLNINASDLGGYEEAGGGGGGVYISI